MSSADSFAYFCSSNGEVGPWPATVYRKLVEGDGPGTETLTEVQYLLATLYVAQDFAGGMLALPQTWVTKHPPYNRIPDDQLLRNITYKINQFREMYRKSTKITESAGKY